MVGNIDVVVCFADMAYSVRYRKISILVIMAKFLSCFKTEVSSSKEMAGAGGKKAKITFNFALQRADL